MKYISLFQSKNNEDNQLSSLNIPEEYKSCQYCKNIEINEVKEDIDDEYDFILDNSLSIQDKIYRYMNKQYDDVMSMELLSSYLKDALN